MVEFSEGTYKALWFAIVKGGDKDSLSLWHTVVHQYTYPVLYYTMEKGLLQGFLDEIKNNNVTNLDISMILHNCRKKGYHYKHYSNLNKN